MILDSNISLLEAGAALHWLVSRDKMPVESAWSARPRYTAEQLRASYRDGNNIGLRTGEPSKIGDNFLHVLDLDIRKQATASEAWAELLKLLPTAKRHPSVISGSGGESRHLYFLAKEPLRSKVLCKSIGFEMVYDAKKKREIKKFDWQIELKGSGTQVVIPPSVHPDTGLPYAWERPLDFDMAFLMEANTDSWNVAVVHRADFDDDDLEIIMRQEPLDIDREKIDSILNNLSEDWVDERPKWLDVGMALHHQFRGSNEGFNVWCDWSEQSAKFNERDSVAVWKSFRGSRDPKTFKSLILATAPALAAEATYEPDTSGDLSDLLGDSPLGRAQAATKLDVYDPNWRQLLDLVKDGDHAGSIKNTMPNLRLILANDPRTRGVIGFNEFTQECVVIRQPGRAARGRERPKPLKQLEGEAWANIDPLNGNLWLDIHDHAIREIFELPMSQGGYGLKVSDRDLKSSVAIVADEHRFHPVRDRLESLSWDGAARAERLYIDYLGAEDSAYHRAIGLLTLMGAVARIYEPGHKFDYVPILMGAQGIRKSTFVESLAWGWFAELEGDLQDRKAMVEKMQGAWILEIPEMQGFSKADSNTIKGLISARHDKVRMAYARRAQVFYRQCIFIGSTNDDEVLRDPTGARRFWPIHCQTDQIDIERLKTELPQIWAEAVVRYKTLRHAVHTENLPLYITDRIASDQAKEIQSSQTAETAYQSLAGQVQNWLDTPVGDDSGFDDLDLTAVKELRNETCIMQIWKEMMEREGPIDDRNTMLIGKALKEIGWARSKGPVTGFKINQKYGRCRIYFRD